MAERAAAGADITEAKFWQRTRRECASLLRLGGAGLYSLAQGSRRRTDQREHLSDKENKTPMAATLQNILLTPDIRPHVVADCQKLIEQEVSGKSGVSGTAVKLAYKTARTFAPGYLQDTVESLLPDMVVELEPYWTDFNASGASGFGDYLAKRGEEVSEALLSVTDAHAKNSQRPTILKAYRAVRGSAAKHVVAALPNVGSLVQKYAA